LVDGAKEGAAEPLFLDGNLGRPLARKLEEIGVVPDVDQPEEAISDAGSQAPL